MPDANVKDFGATGDGKTDDTKSIQEALNYVAGRTRPSVLGPVPPNAPTQLVWSRLNLFLSRDVLERRYQKRHGRELGAAKAKEILAHIEQGREYFLSADTAGALVRPLLQYYGVLALSRAVVLVREPSVRETALAPAHGLQSTLNGANDLEDLRLTITNGTFAELVRATGNVEEIPVFWPPIPQRRSLASPLHVPTVGSSFPFADLLARLPALASLFEESLARRAHCHATWTFILSLETHTELHILPGAFGLIEIDALHKLFPSLRGLEVHRRESHNFLGPTPHLAVRLPHRTIAELQGLLPPLLASSSALPYLVEPYAGGWSLSTIASLFAGAFALSTLVRFHPTHWARLINHEKGDRLLPVLDRLQAVIQEEVPRLVLAELER